MRTATFDLAANDYDARSFGNFGEVAVMAAGDGNESVHMRHRGSVNLKRSIIAAGERC